MKNNRIAVFIVSLIVKSFSGVVGSTEVDIIPTYVPALKAKYDGLSVRIQRYENDPSFPVWQCRINFMPLHPAEVIGYKQSIVKMDYYINSHYDNLEKDNFHTRFPGDELNSSLINYPRVQIPTTDLRGHFVRWQKNNIEHLSDIVAALDSFKKPDGNFPYYKLTGTSLFWESYNCCTFNIALLHRLGIDFSSVTYFSANIDYKNASYWSCIQTAKPERVLAHIKSNKGLLRAEFHQKNYDIYFNGSIKR